MLSTANAPVEAGCSMLGSARPSRPLGRAARASVGVDLVVTDYNLTLVPQPPPDSGQITVEGVELAQILHDPVVGGEPWRAVSARDQLSVVLRPPAATVIDHNGASPARPEMVATAIGLIEMFSARGFLTQASGWNVQGHLVGVDAGDAMSRLVDTQRLAEMLGSRDNAWSVPQVTLSLEPGGTGADRINVILRVSTEPGGQERLTFDANVHSDRAPGMEHLQDEAATVWGVVRDIITRVMA